MASLSKPRGNLFRKYVVLFATAVGGTLLATWLLGTYFAYEDHKKALVRIQQEQALGAASRVEQFIKEIERQIGWTTQTPWEDTPTLDLARVYYLRLLRKVPAVREISHLDPSGKEQLRLSLMADSIPGTRDTRHRRGPSDC